MVGDARRIGRADPEFENLAWGNGDSDLLRRAVHRDCAGLDDDAVDARPPLGHVRATFDFNAEHGREVAVFARRDTVVGRPAGGIAGVLALGSIRLFGAANTFVEDAVLKILAVDLGITSRGDIATRRLEVAQIDGRRWACRRGFGGRRWTRRRG